MSTQEKTDELEFLTAPAEDDSRWPSFAADEIEAAVRVLASGKVNYWTGEEGIAFERAFAGYTGCRHALALANGTVALELALRVLGVGPGDEVITTARTYIASASCAALLGARPVPADVDRDSQNLTAATIEPLLTPRTKAIVAVHLAGWPCDLDPILELARGRGVAVVEDCAQAHGATYKGRRAGSIGAIGAFSFCQDKIMTTAGEGGMITLNSTEMFEAAWAFRDNGKSYEAVHRRAHAPGYRWVHESFGSNWRMTEVQSAIGRLQLEKLPAWLRTRRAHAAALNTFLGETPGLRITVPPAEAEHAYYKYYCFVVPGALKSDWSRDRILAEVNARGIPCRVGSCSEIYLEKAFPAAWRPERRLPVARELGETSLMFDVHPTLSAQQVERAASVLREVMKLAVR